MILRLLTWCAVLVGMFASVGVRADDIPRGAVVLPDRTYYRAGGVDQQLDYHRLPGVTPRPTVVFYHGGGWMGGRREGTGFLVERFPTRSWNVATVNYRLGGIAPPPAAAAPFFEFHGSEVGVADQMRTVEAISAEMGGASFQGSDTAEGLAGPWEARHHALWIACARVPGAEVFSTDARVPINQPAEVVAAARGFATASGLSCRVVGHVGNGNGNFDMFVVHLPAKRDAAERQAKEVAQLAIAARGTLTGAHGIGHHKPDLLVGERGAEAVAIMRGLKHTLEPAGLFNPGSTVAEAMPS